MFSKMDGYFIGLAGRMLGYLHERFALSPPMVLKETLTGGVMAYGAVLIALMYYGPLLMLACLALSIPFSGPSCMRLLRRYARDSQKEWDSDLGRTYMALAIGRQESMRNARLLYLALVAFLIANSWGAVLTRGLSKVDILLLAMSVITLVYEYFSAAEPKSPGDRRRFAQPSFSTAGGSR
ncbi:MAG: hypothetical protein ACRCTD_05760 [Beijerinckiaceae bacterium]